MRILSLLAFVTSLICGSAVSAHAEKKKKEAEAQPQQEAGHPELNACGCYQGSDGTCRCVKKSKCGCPGECEPAGCEEKRRKAEEREAQEEVKRAQEEEKKRNAELAKKREEMDRSEVEREKTMRGGRLQDRPDAAP